MNPYTRFFAIYIYLLQLTSPTNQIRVLRFIPHHQTIKVRQSPTLCFQHDQTSINSPSTLSAIFAKLCISYPQRTHQSTWCGLTVHLQCFNIPDVSAKQSVCGNLILCLRHDNHPTNSHLQLHTQPYTRFYIYASSLILNLPINLIQSSNILSSTPTCIQV